MKKWYKLDNAAKIFPSVSNERRSNLFRISFTMQEEIDPLLLQSALDMTIDRFSTFKVKLKSGLFWYYLEENKEAPIVVKEDPYILKTFNLRESKGYLFRVSYYHKRIILEVFHVLTDGYGGLEFMKSLTYNYLTLKGNKINSQNMILSDLETTVEESQDSFVKSYDGRIKINRTEHKARHFTGTIYEENWISLITGKISEEDMRMLCYKYDCSNTQFIASCIIKSAYASKDIIDKKRKNPFQVFVPVNLRRFFESKTIRNFSLYVRTFVDLENELTFEEIVSKVKTDLTGELQKEKLFARMMSNVKWEKMLVMRIVPLFIKKIAFKIAYVACGESANSFSLSNLGKIELPNDMKQFVDEVVFSNGAGDSAPINMGVTSYNGNINMTFTSKIIERNLQKEFFRTLSSLGAKVIVETNELEVL